MVAFLHSMFNQLVASSSWNEFQIKKNLSMIFLIIISHKLLSILPLPMIDRLLSSRLIFIFEWLALSYYAIHTAMHLPLPLAVRDRLFKSGALEQAIFKLASDTKAMFRNGIFGFTKATAPTPANVSSASAAPLVPAATLPINKQNWFGPLNPPANSKTKDKVYPSYMFQSTSDPSYKIALPMHEIRPAHITPKVQTTRTNKTLWRLLPQPHVVERFRQEQYLDFDKNWDRFDNRSSKVYYDRVQLWIKDYILKPLLRTVELVDKQLQPNTGLSYTNCPVNVLALLISDPSAMDDAALPVALVQKMLTMPQYENETTKKYILARVQELVKQSRFRLLFTHENDVPSDQEIIFHLFKEYVTFTMPSVIPPLLRPQSDIFKFLLIYFYITEDIKNDIFY
ncbi:hypothetical protein BX666DRAFT_1982091 [Dichotomocladium elegans]|nr:hypothetical protein BX666DRAFT_1982091 [Dichotomocladium elegans]